MSQAAGEIRCMLIPLREGRLLLPNAAVSEIIGYRDPEPVAPDLDWLQGRVAWHQRDVLVVDFERLMGREDTAAGIRQRIAVCYTLKPDGEWPLVGLLTQGIPRLLRVSRAAIESAERPGAGDSPVRMQVRIGGEALLVPDLDYLQAQLPAA